jgi:sulfur carrier protein
MTSLPHICAQLQPFLKYNYILNPKGMELKINNQTKQFATDSLTVQALLDLEIPEKQNGIALAVNNTVIPKSSWNSHPLKETDDILIISATQGG